MRCVEVMELMQRNLDGDLTKEEFHQLENHLFTCNECRELNDRFRQLSLDLETLPEVELPFSLVDAILPRMNNELAPTLELFKKEERKISKGMYWALGSSAAAVLVAAILWPWTNPQIPNKPGSHPENVIAAQKSEGFSLNKEASPTKDTTAIKEQDSTINHSSPTEQVEKRIDQPDTEMKNIASSPAPMTKTQMKEEPSEKGSTNEMALDAEVNRKSKENIALSNTEKAKPNRASVETKQALPEQLPSIVAAPDTTMKDHGSVAMAPAMKSYTLSLQDPLDQEFQHPSVLMAGGGGGSVAGAGSTNQQVTRQGIKYPSPGGKQTATILDQSVIVQNSQGVMVYQGHQFEPVQQVQIHWLDNQQLTYELYLPNGVERWRINLTKGQEQKE
ncbi:MAG TPA: zf-HC2 domain-containing protein [Bacillota bacterium]|nr:zf-HC2 domain-containing protein [Bacillota bacterium]